MNIYSEDIHSVIVSNDWAVLVAVGRVFQALGPAELKDESWH